MTKPKLTQSEAQALLNKYSLPEPVVLLGIRGYYKKTMGNPVKNDRNIYDDAIFIVAPDFFGSFNANTDPSVTRKGVSVLKPGVHYYKKGRHKINSPKGYDALRPATPGEKLPVIRDEVGESLGIAINIHRGGYNTTSSLGCQTVYPTQWESFIKTVYDQMKRYDQKKIPYVLIEF